MAREISGNDGVYTITDTTAAASPLLVVSGSRNQVIVTGQLNPTTAGPSIVLTGADNYLRIDSTLPGNGPTAIQGSDFADTVFIRGSIAGAVRLGGGSDYFQTNYDAALGDVFGGSGDDTLTTFSGSRALRFWGEGGNDSLSGGSAADRLDGGADDDRLQGNEGADQLTGGSGDDWLKGGPGNDTIAGGGNAGDIAVFDGLFADFTIAMNGGNGSVTDRAPGDRGDEGVDTITGVDILRFADRQIDLRVPLNALVLSTPGQAYVNAIDRYDYFAVELNGAAASFTNQATIRGTATPHTVVQPDTGDVAALVAALAVRAPGVTIDNAQGATIAGIGDALQVFPMVQDDNLHLTNRGTIVSTEASAVVGGNTLVLNNTVTGVIDGAFYGVTMGNGTVVNDGTIRGGYAAMFAGAAFDLTNRGTIEGRVEADARQGRIDNGGLIDGSVQVYGGTLVNRGHVTEDLVVDVFLAGYQTGAPIIAHLDNRATLDGDIRITGEAPFVDSLEASGALTTEIVNSGTVGGSIVSDPTLEMQPDGSVPDARFAENFVNDGTVLGRVDLAAGDDIVVNRGTVSGGVDLGSGDDRYTGGAAGGAAEGGEGQDWLIAGSGASRFTGGEGNDSLWGGAGADLFDGGPGDDTIVGGGGIDTVTYADAGGGVDIDLAWLEDQDTQGAGVDTLLSIENAIGSAFEDRLAGNAAGNVLTGGAMADRFVFAQAPGAGGIDTITDFSAAAGDQVVLAGTAFGLAAGGLAPGAYALGSAAADADDRLIYDASSGALSFDADGNGAAAAVQFATLTGAPQLGAADIVVI